LQNSVDKLGSWLVYLYKSTHKKNITPIAPQRLIECLPYLPDFQVGIKATSEDEAFIEKYSNPKKYKDFIKFQNPFNPDKEEGEEGEKGEKGEGENGEAPQNRRERRDQKDKEKVDRNTLEGTKVGFYLNCHLYRQEIPKALEKEYNFTISKSALLLKKSAEISCQLQDVDFVLKSLTMTQLFVQAIWGSGDSLQLKQLPHFDQFDLAKKKTKYTVDTIAKFQALPEEERKTLLKHLPQEQYDEVLAAAAQIPRVTILQADFVVLDEKTTVVGDVVTFICKFHVSYGINTPEPKKTKGIKTSEEFKIENDREIERQKTSPRDVLPAYTPHFPEARESHWWVILGQKEKLVAVNYVPELTTAGTVSCRPFCPFPLSLGSHSLSESFSCAVKRGHHHFGPFQAAEGQVRALGLQGLRCF